MTEKPLAEQHNPENLLDKAALSLADAQASSRKAQELKEQLLAGRSAVEALIGTLFAQTAATERFEAAAAAAEAEQEQVEEQLESLEDRLDTVFEALEDLAGAPDATLSAELAAAVAAPAAEEAAAAEVVAAAEEEEAAALPAWFGLPAGLGSLAALAAEVEDQLQHLGGQLAEKAEQAAEQIEKKIDIIEEKAELQMQGSLQQTLQQISTELAELNLLAAEPAAAEVAEDVVADAIIEDTAAAEAAAATVAELVAELADEPAEVAEEPAEVAEEAAEVAEEPVKAAPLQEVAAAYPGYNPTWMALPQQESAAEPAEAPTAPLAESAEREEGRFAPAWFKATEEKEAAAAVKAAPAAEFAPAAPVIDEDDPVEVAARAMEARRLQEETEKMAAQLAEAERMRLKAEEELRRILQEIEGEQQNDADDDIAALLRGYKH